ncbi:MAG: DNA-directed RNA polymerase subunit omega [Eubacteriales bacterium]|nr:DNA-directed RNA polymerase subunit omega [Eubacteriales bacterium]
MIQPPLDKLMKKVDSRYTLVIATAKRARQITDQDKKINKPVINAVHDIMEDRIELDYSCKRAEKVAVAKVEATEETIEE